WLLGWDRPAPQPGLDHRALDPARVRAREVPPTRGAWVEAARGCAAEVVTTFTSAKALDPETCTVCLRCVSSCPTGALTATRRRDELRFDPGACVRCGVCHDVCEPRALTLADPVRLGALTEGPASLGRLAVRRCIECGDPFPIRSGSERCPRCDDLDAEARELVAGPRGSA
ncbi:MAG: 4Fe-4S binding protein, partial [Myxococcota bacterium]